MGPTTSDRVRQWATVVIFVGTVAVNAAANVLPINGQATGAISDRFDVLVIPAGYVFSIWGLIYLLLAAFTVDQARPSRATDPTLRRLGWLPLLTGVLNSAWLVLFHYEAFVLTVPVMVALLVTLIAINALTFADRDRLTGLARWTVRLPFSVYLGWITVATIANVAQTLDALGFDAFGIAPPLVAGAVLSLGAVIAVTYAGIAVKEAGTTLVPWVAAGWAIVIAALVVGTILGGRAPTARSLVGVEPTGSARA